MYVRNYREKFFCQDEILEFGLSITNSDRILIYR